MATAPLAIYETTSAEELYETAPEQELALREEGIHFLSARQASCEKFVAEWQALVARTGEPNPFFEPWFLLPSLARLDPKGRVEIAAYYLGGELTALAPLTLSSNYYGYPLPHWEIWLHPNAFCGSPLIARGFERHFWRALTGQLGHEQDGALFLHLPQIAVDSPGYCALQAEISSHDRPFATVGSVERAMLRSNLSAEAYFEDAMPNKKRKELRRQAKRLGEEGTVTFERQGDEIDVAAWSAEFLALEKAGWKGDEGSSLASDAATASLFEEALLGAAASGKLERLTMRIDGRPIAMLANFITPPGAFSFKTAFDEDYARFSPGVLLQKENLALLDRSGIEWCDSCAAEGHPMIERIWRQKRMIASCNVALGGPLRQAIARQLFRRETRERT